MCWCRTQSNKCKQLQQQKHGNTHHKRGCPNTQTLLPFTPCHIQTGLAHPMLRCQKESAPGTWDPNSSTCPLSSRLLAGPHTPPKKNAVCFFGGMVRWDLRRPRQWCKDVIGGDVFWWILQPGSKDHNVSHRALYISISHDLSPQISNPRDANHMSSFLSENLLPSTLVTVKMSKSCKKRTEKTFPKSNRSLPSSEEKVPDIPLSPTCRTPRTSPKQRLLVLHEFDNVVQDIPLMNWKWSHVTQIHDGLLVVTCLKKKMFSFFLLIYQLVIEDSTESKGWFKSRYSLHEILKCLLLPTTKCLLLNVFGRRDFNVLFTRIQANQVKMIAHSFKINKATLIKKLKTIKLYYIVATFFSPNPPWQT